MTNFTDPRMAYTPLFSRSYDYHSNARKYLLLVQIISNLWGAGPIEKKALVTMPDAILDQLIQKIGQEQEEQVPDGIIFGGH